MAGFALLLHAWGFLALQLVGSSSIATAAAVVVMLLVVFGGSS